MIAVKKDKVIPNMVLAEDLVGTNRLVLRTGTVLTPRFISLLQINTLFPIQSIPITNESYNVTLLKVTTADHQDISVAQTMGGPEDGSLLAKYGVVSIKENLYEVSGDLTDCSETLHIPGDLSINGSMKACASVFVSGSLTVRGNVSDCSLSVKKDVMVGQAVRNTESHFKVHAFGLLTAKLIENATVNAGDVRIEKSIKDSEIIVDNNIEGPSSDQIINSRLQAGYNILLGSVSEGTTLVIYSEKQSKIMQKLFEVEKKLRDFDKEIEPLKQSIKVFQLLKDRLHELPEEKRQKLLSNVRLVKTKLEKKKFFQDQLQSYREESDKIRKSREKNPIIIEAEVVKGTKVVIDNSTFIVQTQDRGVVFYKKSIIIMGKKDKEWGRLV